MKALKVFLFISLGLIVSCSQDNANKASCEEDCFLVNGYITPRPYAEKEEIQELRKSFFPETGTILSCDRFPIGGLFYISGLQNDYESTLQDGSDDKSIIYISFEKSANLDKKPLIIDIEKGSYSYREKSIREVFFTKDKIVSVNKKYNSNLTLNREDLVLKQYWSGGRDSASCYILHGKIFDVIKVKHQYHLDIVSGWREERKAKILLEKNNLKI